MKGGHKSNEVEVIEMETGNVALDYQYVRIVGDRLNVDKYKHIFDLEEGGGRNLS